MRPQEPVAVEVDEVRRVFRDPDLGLPGDVPSVPDHGLLIGKRGNKDFPQMAAREQDIEFVHAFRTHRPMRRDGLDQHQPALGSGMPMEQDHVGHLTVVVDHYADGRQELPIMVNLLGAGVSDIGDHRPWCETGCETFDDISKERTLSTG